MGLFAGWALVSMGRGLTLLGVGMLSHALSEPRWRAVRRESEDVEGEAMRDVEIVVCVVAIAIGLYAAWTIAMAVKAG